MNWDQIEGKWKRFTGSARERWGKLTDNDWETIAGKKDQLVGRIQERYGVAKAEAEKQADEWSPAQTQFENERNAAAILLASSAVLNDRTRPTNLSRSPPIVPDNLASVTRVPPSMILTRPSFNCAQESFNSG